MSDASNETLVEKAKATVRDRLKREAAKLTPTEVASAIAEVDILLDLAPVGSAGEPVVAAPAAELTAPMRIATLAPETTQALEAMFAAADEQARVNQGILTQSGLSPLQTAAARAHALAIVRQAVRDARRRASRGKG